MHGQHTEDGSSNPHQQWHACVHTCTGRDRAFAIMANACCEMQDWIGAVQSRQYVGTAIILGQPSVTQPVVPHLLTPAAHSTQHIALGRRRLTYDTQGLM